MFRGSTDKPHCREMDRIEKPVTRKLFHVILQQENICSKAQHTRNVHKQLK